MYPRKPLQKRKVYNNEYSPLVMQIHIQKIRFGHENVICRPVVCRSSWDKVRSRWQQENIFPVRQQSKSHPKHHCGKSDFTLLKPYGESARMSYCWPSLNKLSR